MFNACRPAACLTYFKAFPNKHKEQKQHESHWASGWHRMWHEAHVYCFQTAHKEDLINCGQLALKLASCASSSSSAFDVMVALTRSSLPWVPHTWMSGTNPLQTPELVLWAISAALLTGGVSRTVGNVLVFDLPLHWGIEQRSLRQSSWDGYSICSGLFWGKRWWSVGVVVSCASRYSLDRHFVFKYAFIINRSKYSKGSKGWNGHQSFIMSTYCKLFVLAWIFVWCFSFTNQGYIYQSVVCRCAMVQDAGIFSAHHVTRALRCGSRETQTEWESSLGMSWWLQLSILMKVCVFMCFIRLSFYLSVCLSVLMSVNVCLSVLMSVWHSVREFTGHGLVVTAIQLNEGQVVCQLSVCVCVCLCPCVFVCVCVSVCLCNTVWGSSQDMSWWL